MTSADASSTEDLAEARVHHIAQQLGDNLTSLTAVVFEEIRDRIPELKGDQVIIDLLEASTHSNLESLVYLLNGQVPIEHLTVPDAADEYARRLAQRDISPNALVRAYRIGQERITSWALTQFQQAEADPWVALAATKRLSHLTFQYVDRVSEGVVSTYQAEHERWLANRSTVRLEVIENILAGATVRAESAEPAIGYRLHQNHLGLLVWRTDSQASTDDLAELEQLVGHLARELKTGSPLFVPRDRATGWAWLPLGHDVGATIIDTARAALEGIDRDFASALGVPAHGIEGFRATHQDALTAQRVALAAQNPGQRVTAFTDSGVRAASLLIDDLTSTQRLVRSALGDLAKDNKGNQRLRETLLTFVQEKGSYVAAAERLFLHKNTVKYRVARAVDARGRAIDDERLDLELALIACEWLGHRVLLPDD